MGLTGPIVRQIVCQATGKRVYADQDAAWASLSYTSVLISSGEQRAGTARPVRSYRCPHCGFVHLTSRQA